MLMILQCDLQEQLQPCFHQYCERMILKSSNNNYYMTLGDILTLVLLGETLLLCNFHITNWDYKELICFHLLIFNVHLIMFLYRNWVHVYLIFLLIDHDPYQTSMLILQTYPGIYIYLHFPFLFYDPNPFGG